MARGGAAGLHFVVLRMHRPGIEPDLDQQFPTLIALPLQEEVLGKHEPWFECEEGPERFAEVHRTAQALDDVLALEPGLVRLGQKQAHPIERRTPGLAESLTGPDDRAASR